MRELVLSSDQFSQAEVQPRGGADGTGDGISKATHQKDLLRMTEDPTSLYSVLVTHMSLKVESEPRMEPPTQALKVE